MCAPQGSESVMVKIDTSSVKRLIARAPDGFARTRVGPNRPSRAKARPNASSEVGAVPALAGPKVGNRQCRRHCSQSYTLRLRIGAGLTTLASLKQECNSVWFDRDQLAAGPHRDELSLAGSSSRPSSMPCSTLPWSPLWHSSGNELRFREIAETMRLSLVR